MTSPQNAILQRLLHDLRSVPFYENRTEFASLPVVSKRLMLHRLDEFVSRSVPGNRAALIEFLRAPTADGSTELPFNESIVVDQTSGSSGVPFRIAKTKAERARLSWAIWQFRRSVDPEATPAGLYAAIHAPPNAPRFSAPHFLRGLAAQRYRWIHGNPSVFSRLISLAKEATEPVPDTLKVVENSGQHLDETLRAALEGELGLRVVDQYGCREVSVIGYATRSNTFSPLSQNTVVELLRQDDSSISHPGVFGRVVVTSLHCRLMPFIRYDTGDEAAWLDEGGQRYLTLCPYRGHHLIVGSQGIYGPAVFKNILIAAYRSIGYPPVTQLQIRQCSPTLFDLAVNETPSAEPLRATIETIFNRMKIIPSPATFRIHSVAPAIDPLATPSKPELFTNAGFHTSDPN